MRILLITNSPTPYRLPLFREIDRQCREAGSDFCVVFGVAGYARRQWSLDLDNSGFEFRVLRSRSLSSGADNERTMFMYTGLLSVIREYGPDVIIAPGFSVATCKVLAYSLRTRVPFLIWTGSLPSGRSRSSALRELQRRLLVARAAGGVAYGTLAGSYLQRLGMPSANVQIATNTVETSFFQAATEAERRRLDTATGPAHFTYVGYLSPRKNVARLIELVAALRQRRSDFVLDIIGDGSERARLERLAGELGVRDVVVFHGYRQQVELPRFYARSRCLIFQTDFDIWGLVAIEAMSAGVPVLASINAGVTHDLIRDGDTGFAVDFADTSRSLTLLNWMLDHPRDAVAMGERASRFVAEHACIARTASAFIAASRRVVGTTAVPVPAV